MNRVLVLAAVGEAATGAAMLIVPSLVGQLLLGAELTGIAMIVARVAGAPATDVLLQSVVSPRGLALAGATALAAAVLVWVTVSLQSRAGARIGSLDLLAIGALVVTAVALVRPSRSLYDLEASSVKKKWKDKAFAAGTDRAEMEQAAKEFGVDIWEHTGNVILAMRGIAPELGLVGNIQQ